MLTPSRPASSFRPLLAQSERYFATSTESAQFVSYQGGTASFPLCSPAFSHFTNPLSKSTHPQQSTGLAAERIFLNPNAVSLSSSYFLRLPLTLLSPSDRLNLRLYPHLSSDMSATFPPEYREPYRFFPDSDARKEVRLDPQEARISVRLGIQDSLARQRYLELDRLLESLIKEHPESTNETVRKVLKKWKGDFLKLVERPRDEDRLFNLYTTSNFEAIRAEVSSLVGKNLVSPLSFSSPPQSSLLTMFSTAHTT